MDNLGFFCFYLDMSQFILAIETSTRRGEAAVSVDGTVLNVRPLDTDGKRHAQTLVTEIDAMLAESSLRKQDCRAVAISIGPGSFTGLRVGVVFAKTLAYALGCKVVAVDTFLALAAACPNTLDHVAVVSDAQRSGLFVAEYKRQSDRTWQREGKIEIVPTRAWCEIANQRSELSDAPLAVIGPNVAKLTDQLAACNVLGEEYHSPTANTIATLGEQLFEQLATDDYWQLEPFYLRKSAAEEKWDAAHSNET